MSKIIITGERQDDVFPKSKLVTLESLTNMPSRKGLEKAVVSNGKVVNVVSNSYAHLPNEVFLSEIERKLFDADIKYETRSVNRNDSSFGVSYILNDDRYVIKVRSGDDTLKPMIHVINSYDGSCKTTAHFGMFRDICTNGLHIGNKQLGFAVKHRGDMADIVIPAIAPLVDSFISNEYYNLSKKFEVLAETPIKNIEEFVRMTSSDMKLFTYESSEKNPLPSLNARRVIETIKSETAILGEPANLWVGYNAFNEILHNKLKKTFTQQAGIDSRLFDSVLAQA